MPPAPDRSPAEAFLAGFHDARPGLTTKAFGALPVACGGRAFASSYEALADAVAADGSPRAVLDVACGDGHLLALLAARSTGRRTLAGIDFSAGELAAARMRLGATADLCLARAQQLPFAGGTFDGVTCHMALMLMDDLDRVLAEVRRVLAPGATFAAVVGAQSPPSVATASFVAAIARHPRLPHLADVRLGDGRLRSREGIVAALAPAFAAVAVDDIDCSRRLTPDELWSAFLDMYDLHFLGDGDREVVRCEYVAAVAPHRDPDGRLAFPQRLPRLVARAA